MEFVNLIAATAQTATQTATAPGTGQIVPLQQIWDQIASLGLLEALTFISFGTVCLFYGWRIFKVLVIISFSLLGLVIGLMISEKIGGDKTPLLGILLAIVLGIVSVPLMRWSVSILGAAAGGVITAGIWYACKFPEQYIWAGGLVGVVAGGMISFIVFRISVMLFSSLGGSGLITSGVLALLHLYPQTKDQVQNLFFSESWFLPTIIVLPTLIGVYWQNKFIKGSPGWSV